MVILGGIEQHLDRELELVMTTSGRHHFVGGMRSRRGNATWPLASLTIDHELGVSVQLRGRLPQVLFGLWIPKVSYPAGADTQAENVRGGFTGSGGVRLQADGWPSVVFWTFRPREVVTALAEHGVRTTWDDRPPKVWTRP